MRRFVLIAISAVALAMISMAVVPYFIPTETYRGWIEKRIAHGLKARISIGKFHLRFIPYPGYTIKDLNIVSTEQPFNGYSVFSAKRVEGSLSLIGLLSGRVETKIKAYNAKIDYRTSDGTSNLGQIIGWVPAANPVVMPTEGVPASRPSLPSDGVQAETPPAGLPPPADGAKPEGIPFREIPVRPDGSLANEPPVPSPPPQDEGGGSPGPTSLKLLDLIATDAFAGEAGVTPIQGGYELIVRSLDIVNGEIDIVPEQGETFIIDKVDLSARNIVRKTVPGAGGRMMSADVHMNGAILNSASPNFSVNGKFLYDGSRREITAKGIKLFLLGAQASADVTLNTGTYPSSFDLHFATSSLSPAILEPLYPRALKDFLSTLVWRGSAAIDLSAKGTSDAYGAELILDITSSDMAYGKIFSKGAGLPFKITSSIFVQPEEVIIREMSASLGDDRLILKGDVKRDEFLTSHINLSGDGLDDSLLKIFFPKFAVLDAFEGLGVSIDADGPLIGEQPVQFKGNFKAARAKLSNTSIENFEGVLGREQSQLVFLSIKGTFAGGEVSGNGSITFGEKTEYRFDGVAEHSDVEKFDSLGGVLRGQSSVVIHAYTDGIDPLSITNNLKITGSLIVPTGQWTNAGTLKGVFSQDTWKAIETLAGVPLDVAQKTKIVGASDDFSNLNSTFEMTGQSLAFGAMSWGNPMYSVEAMQGSLSLPQYAAGPSAGQAPAVADAQIKADAIFIIPSTIAKQLVTDVSARKKILDKEERLVLPVIITGSLKLPAYQLDHVKLVRQVEEKPIDEAPAREPAKIIRSGEEKGLPGKASPPEAKAPEQQTEKPLANKPSAPRAPKEEKRDSDEVLRVIIGR